MEELIKFYSSASKNDPLLQITQNAQHFQDTLTICKPNYILPSYKADPEYISSQKMMILHCIQQHITLDQKHTAIYILE